jgi:hypothetical protein
MNYCNPYQIDIDAWALSTPFTHKRQWDDGRNAHVHLGRFSNFDHERVGNIFAVPVGERRVRKSSDAWQAASCLREAQAGRKGLISSPELPPAFIGSTG